MAIATRASLRLALMGVRNGDPNLGGGLTVEGLLDLVFGDGVGVGEINRVLQRKDLNVPNPAGVTINLITEPGLPDPTMNLANVKLLLVEADPANSNSLQYDPTATAQGWDTVYSADTVLAPGEILLFVSKAGALVDANARDLIFTPIGGADQKIRNLIVLGSTA